MDGAVAKVLDELRLRGDAGRRKRLEARFGQQRRQAVLVRKRELCFCLVEPLHSEFKGPAGVEAGCARIRVDERLRASGCLIYLRPLGLKKRKVAHPLELAPECALLERSKHVIKLNGH